MKVMTEVSYNRSIQLDTWAKNCQVVNQVISVHSKISYR